MAPRGLVQWLAQIAAQSGASDQMLTAVEWEEDAWGLGQALVPRPREVGQRHPRALLGRTGRSENTKMETVETVAAQNTHRHRCLDRDLLLAGWGHSDVAWSRCSSVWVHQHSACSASSHGLFYHLRHFDQGVVVVVDHHSHHFRHEEGHHSRCSCHEEDPHSCYFRRGEEDRRPHYFHLRPVCHPVRYVCEHSGAGVSRIGAVCFMKLIPK